MPRPKKGDYEVGYGRPPRHSQFRKGKSGNPKGRRRGAASLLDLLRKALEEKVTIKEGGSTRKIPKRVAIAKQLVNKAVSGDNKFVKLILEMIGPSSERGRQEELEASHREGADARERVARKLQQMSERLNAGLPLVPEETEEPETSENAKDAKRR